MKNNKYLILDIAIAVLLVAFIALHFIPYFCYKDETFSIAKFLWTDVEKLTKFLKALYGTRDFKLNPYVDWIVLSFILPVVVIGLRFWKPNTVVVVLADFAWGFCATYGYFSSKLLRTTVIKENAYLLNPGLFWLYMVIILIVDALIIWRTIRFVPNYIKKFLPEK